LIQQVDLVVLARLVRTTLANGAAPGGSGWTGDLIKALIDDHDCLIGLGILVKDIINGTLNGIARELLVSCVLCAVGKPSGGSRPIAMGEAFYKLSCLYALSLVGPTRTCKALGPIQFALSPGGPESALHMNRGKLSAEFASSEGVRQGDPLGSLLFSLSMRNTYSNAINNLDCGCNG